MANQQGQAPTGDGCLSLIIPAYNEEAGIRQAIDEADAALAALASAYEILVVDDGSSDGTAAVVADAAEGRPHLRLLRHAENRGYGAALRTGFKAARFDRIAFTDADCQFYLADLASLVALTDQCPLAVGYRIDRQDDGRRRFFSWGYNQLVRLLLGTRVRDCDCALKVFRKDALRELLPQSNGFFVNTEMLTRARQLGYQAAEVGVRHRPRLHGSSKVSFADIPRTLRVLLPFWWSQVLFPASPIVRRWLSDEKDKGQRTTDNGQRTVFCWVLLLVLAGLLCFSRFTLPLQEPQEARYAEIPRQMLDEGRWLVPVLHGEPYYDKPPLLYWLVMASYTLFGVHDWAARLVPCSAAFLSVIVTYLWGRRTLGSRAALAGALVLCLSARFVYLGRMLTFDSVLCLWTVTALAAAHVALSTPVLRWRWWLLSAAACGLGLLTKGPVILALVLVPVLAIQRLDPRTARLRWRGWVAYLAVAVGLALPWYLAMSSSEPDFASYFFWKHHVLRYVAPFDHEEPAWFYLPGVFLGMLPWTLLLPGLVTFLGRRSVRTAARRPAALGFFLLAFLWCLIFYSAAGCKRAVYILPAFPPLALALGCYLDVLVPREKLQAAGGALLRAGSVLAYRATLIVLLLGIGGSLLATVTGLLTAATGCGLTCLLGVGLAILLYRKPKVLSWGLCGAATFGLLFIGVYLLLPSYARKFSLRGHVRPHAEQVRDAQVPVACYPCRWDSVSFYLRRNDVRAYTPDQRKQLIADLRRQPETLLFVKSGKAVNELLADLPASLEFVPCGRQGTVTVGWVRPRQEPPLGLFARWSTPRGF